MIRPTIDDLLAGVARGLEGIVLPDLPDGAARRQVREAIRVVRRVGAIWDRVGPTLAADNADIADTIRTLPPAATSDASMADAAESPTDLDALYRRNAALQAELLAVDTALHALPDGLERTEGLARLRALYRRMMARELALAHPAPRQTNPAPPPGDTP